MIVPEERLLSRTLLCPIDLVRSSALEGSRFVARQALSACSKRLPGSTAGLPLPTAVRFRRSRSLETFPGANNSEQPLAQRYSSSVRRSNRSR